MACSTTSYQNVIEKHLLRSHFLGSQGRMCLANHKTYFFVIYWFINRYATFLLDFTFCFMARFHNLNISFSVLHISSTFVSKEKNIG